MSLFLPLGSSLILLLFTALSTEIITITVRTPSLTTYNDLLAVHSTTLRCPCSTMIIPYEKFISLSPTLHQVCSSDFVNEYWFSILENIRNPWVYIDWNNTALSQFQLLSDLCQLANKTIDNAVHRFLMQSFIASNVLRKSDFDQRLNATLEQFFESTTIDFSLLVDTVHLLLQIDQPYMEFYELYGSRMDVPTLNWSLINQTNNQMSMKVILPRHVEVFSFFLLMI